MQRKQLLLRQKPLRKGERNNVDGCWKCEKPAGGFQWLSKKHAKNAGQSMKEKTHALSAAPQTSQKTLGEEW